MPLRGQVVECTKRPSSASPLAITTGCSGEPPSSGRSDIRTIGFDEVTTQPGATSVTSCGEAETAVTS